MGCAYHLQRIGTTIAHPRYLANAPMPSARLAQYARSLYGVKNELFPPTGTPLIYIQKLIVRLIGRCHIELTIAIKKIFLKISPTRRRACPRPVVVVDDRAGGWGRRGVVVVTPTAAEAPPPCVRRQRPAGWHATRAAAPLLPRHRRATFERI